jgi:hypothetical protein
MKKSQEMNTIRDRASKNNSPSGRRVLIMGADGLRPDQVRPETMPTYCRLMKNGTFFNSFLERYFPKSRNVIKHILKAFNMLAKIWMKD